MRLRLTAVALSLACALSVSAQSAQSDWDRLLKGNQAFRGSYITLDRLDVRRGELSNSQNPPVTILSCSDSRVPPELVLRQTLGEVFLVRSAGNVTDQLGIASIEYAIKNNWTKLLVILAHEKCGAVDTAMGNPLPPDIDYRNLRALVGKIKASFVGDCPPDGSDCLVFRTHQNAFNAIEDLKKNSTIIAKAIDENHLPVAVAYYRLDGKLEIWQAP